MKIGPAAIKVIKHHEGVKYRPYLCPAHLWTVGVGHLLYPQQTKLPMLRTPENAAMILRKEFSLLPEDNRVWSAAEVDDLLSQDLMRFERGVARLCPNSLSNQGRFESLVSFAFNVGLGNLQRSGLRMKNNRGDFEGAAEEFMKWTKGGGRVLPGLLKRRRDEQALYLSCPS
jgi:lysozyme